MLLVRGLEMSGESSFLASGGVGGGSGSVSSMSRNFSLVSFRLFFLTGLSLILMDDVIEGKSSSSWTINRSRLDLLLTMVSVATFILTSFVVSSRTAGKSVRNKSLG